MVTPYDRSRIRLLMGHAALLGQAGQADVKTLDTLLELAYPAGENMGNPFAGVTVSHHDLATTQEIDGLCHYVQQADDPDHLHECEKADGHHEGASASAHQCAQCAAFYADGDDLPAPSSRGQFDDEALPADAVAVDL